MSDMRDAGPGSAPTSAKPAMDSPKSQQRVTPHRIEVKAEWNGNAIDWQVDGKRPNESKIKFDWDSGAHEISFDLDRDRVLKDRGLRFNCANPIFVHDNIAACPTSGVDEQIDVIECGRDRLQIFDKNSGDPKLLRYQLNFVEDNGALSVCDPIIDNGGGTGRID